MTTSINKKTKLAIFCSILFCGFFSFSSAHAATAIYRSVGPGNTTDLNTSHRTVAISGTTAIFSDAMPDNMGVGDVLQYDPGSGLVVAFISGRTSSSVYTVQSVNGGTPDAASAETSVSVFRAYTSLGEAVSGTENIGIGGSVSDFDSWTGGKDLVAADQQWNITCYGDAEDTTLGVVISGWTTDDTRYIKIYTPYLSSQVGASQRHSGVWDDNKYKLVASDDIDNNPVDPALSVNAGPGANTNSINVWLDGLQIFAGSMSYSANALAIYNTSGTTRISNSIIKADPILGMASFGIYIDSDTHQGTYKIWNNIIYGFLDGGISLNNSLNTLYAYNNTVVGVSTADSCYKRVSGAFVAKNDIAQSCNNGYEGTFDGESAKNLSDLASDAPGIGSINEAVLTFADSSSFNYHLNVSDTAAIGQGVKLSSDTGLSFSIDIDNENRGNTWDIGADQKDESTDDITPPVIPSGLRIY